MFGKFEAGNRIRRTMQLSKVKVTNEQTMIYKILHRKQNIEQHEKLEKLKSLVESSCYTCV
jgi:hypothetical protein